MHERADVVSYFPAENISQKAALGIFAVGDSEVTDQQSGDLLAFLSTGVATDGEPTLGDLSP